MTKMRDLTMSGTVVLCFGLLLAGCGGGDEGAALTAMAQEAAPPAGGVDACSLLTEADVAGAVGGATNPPESSTVGENFSQCLWRIKGGTPLDNAVVLQARGGTSKDDFERFVEENTPEVVGAVTPIPGLGDKAYQQMATFVLSGDSMVVVTVLNNDPPEQQEQTQHELARAAIARLP